MPKRKAAEKVQAAADFMHGHDVPRALSKEVFRWTRFHYEHRVGNVKRKEFLDSLPATLQSDVASSRRGVRRASPPTIRTALPRLRRRRASRACRATNDGDATAISQVPVGAAHQRMGRLGPIPRTCSENRVPQTSILAAIGAPLRDSTPACMQVCGLGGRTLASLHPSARAGHTFTCMHACMKWRRFSLSSAHM